jgi:two-component system, OmpR family, sensor histidine kinase ResE
VTPRRTFGLQGWLVAALLAVGIVASLAVLLVVLPTLESSVRTDRAESERRDLVGKLDAAVAAQGLAFGADAGELQALADRYQQELGGEVEVYYQPGVPFQDPIVVHSPQQAELVTSLPLPQGRFSGRFDDGRAVVAATPIAAASGEAVLMTVRRLEGVAPETAVVRRRVILAMIAVLGLACLAGVAIARVLGGRIRRLAGTAATLAGGDLAARAPRARVAPQELVTLGESLNGMAERLQSLVGQITAERDRDRAMVASLAEGVLAVAPDGAVTLANDAANRYLGLPEGAESLMLEGLPAPILDAILAARRPDGGTVARREISLPGGVELELHAARLSREADAGVVVTLRDVTEERRLERARRDLVANVSHELKTPIAALKGFLELLEGEGVSERHRREFLASMTQETARLERLVEEQLQLARLDAGAVPLVIEEVDLTELVAEIVAPRVPLAERAGVSLSARVAGGRTVMVVADPSRVEQIILILLDNALRHTPAGGRVEIVVGSDDAHATVAVRDTGEGISPEDRPFVFDRFYRGDPSREGRGAGLGLAIARGLAAAHRGSIDLDSTLGEGSTFTLSLPMSRPSAPRPGDPAAAPPVVH